MGVKWLVGGDANVGKMGYIAQQCVLRAYDKHVVTCVNLTGKICNYSRVL